QQLLDRRLRGPRRERLSPGLLLEQPDPPLYGRGGICRNRQPKALVLDLRAIARAAEINRAPENLPVARAIGRFRVGELEPAHAKPVTDQQTCNRKPAGEILLDDER